MMTEISNRWDGYDEYGNLYITLDNKSFFLRYLIKYFEQVIIPLSELISDNYLLREGYDFLEYMEFGQLISGFLSLHALSSEEFMLAYQLTLKACNEDKDLALYRDDFEKGFQSDPRFRNQ